MVKPKLKHSYVCDQCGHDTPKWEGRCSSCGEWNTLVEIKLPQADKSERSWGTSSSLPPQELSTVSSQDFKRLRLESVEMQRVLGGGMVPGSVMVLAGDPGIGKSTLLLRLAADVAENIGPTLYVSGEESISQIKLRAERMGISGKGLYLFQTTNVNDVIEHLDEVKPVLLMVDSIQAMYIDSVSSSAGSVAQIKECTRILMDWAKFNQIPIILTGHVTKGGDIAGPRILEHMVDVVLHMEGDPVSSWRLLRSVKNRFGSTDEVGVFEMVKHGLVEVDDPSKTFLSERVKGSVGSVVVPTMEGTRPILVEVQALTNPSMLQTPRRVASGIDVSRLLLVCAVLSRRTGLSLVNQDVIVNVTSGLKIGEPAADLGMALGIVSSLRNVPILPNLAAIGEVGLSGEIRRVPNLERRINEVARLGLVDCLIPGMSGTDSHGMGTTSVQTITQAIAASMANINPKSDSSAP